MKHFSGNPDTHTFDTFRIHLKRSTAMITGIRSYSGILLMLLLQLNLYGQAGPDGTGIVNGNAQGVVKGTVIDSRSLMPVEFATIVVFHAADSMMAGGTVTDGKGAFSVTGLDYGRYYLVASYVGYRNATVPDIVLDKDTRNANVGSIRLETSVGMLDAVEVTGKLAQVEMKFEKKIYNVATDLSNQSESASEILSKIPSVEVDMEGAVSLRGNQNLQILIDGKPSAMTRSGKGLKQLQGDLIDKVEVITIPSARYDASGEAGIINIVLKKKKDKGIHGTFSLNAGNPANYGGSYSLNYRMNKINLFSNLGLNYRKNTGNELSTQRYHSQDTAYLYDQKGTINMDDLSFNYSLGLDYYVNDRNILTLSVVNELADETRISELTYSDFNSNNELTGVTTRNGTEKAPENNVDATLSYKRLFSDKDRLFTADLKWIQSTEPEKTDIVQLTESDPVPLFQKTGTTENEYNYILQADYVHPLGEETKVETGYKSSKRRIKCDYYLEQKDDFNEWTSIPDYTGNLDYIENIHSFYLMASREQKRFSGQAGIRTEYSGISTRLKTSGSYNFRDYLHFFPSAGLSYKMSEALKLQTNYSYRINRPGFRDLLPFDGYTDSRVVHTGNPDLKPELIHSFEAGLVINTEKITLTGTLYDRMKKNVIYDYELTGTSGDVTVIPVNLSHQNSTGLECGISCEYNERLSVSSDFNFYRSLMKGSYLDDKLESRAYSWTNRSRMKFRVGKLDFQASSNYHAPSVTPQGKNLSYFYLDTGLSHEVFRNKGTVTLTVKDLFNSRKHRSIIETDTYYSRNEFQWHSRQITVSLIFRLNKGKEGNGHREDTFNEESD